MPSNVSNLVNASACFSDVSTTANSLALAAEAVSYDTWSDSMPGVSNALNSGYQWFSGPDDDLSLLSCFHDHSDGSQTILVEGWWDMSRDASPELTTIELQIWDVTDKEVALYIQQTRNASQDFQGGEHSQALYTPRTAGVHEYRLHMKTPGSGVQILGQSFSDGTPNGYLTAYSQSFGLRIWSVS